MSSQPAAIAHWPPRRGGQWAPERRRLRQRRTSAASDARPMTARRFAITTNPNNCGYPHQKAGGILFFSYAGWLSRGYTSIYSPHSSHFLGVSFLCLFYVEGFICRRTRSTSSPAPAFFFNPHHHHLGFRFLNGRHLLPYCKSSTLLPLRAPSPLPSASETVSRLLHTGPAWRSPRRSRSARDEVYCLCMYTLHL